jgi:hypothetical protein
MSKIGKVKAEVLVTHEEGFGKSSPLGFGDTSKAYTP